MNTLVSKCRFSWAVTLIALAALVLSASTASANTAPGAPIGLVVAPGNGKLVVGWSPPEDATDDIAYTVQFKSSASTDWVVAVNGGTQTDAEIAGLTNDTRYDVRVQASNSAGDGQWSNAASAAPHQDVVWAAIMTVDVDDTSQDSHTHGCVDSSISTASIAECRTALTDDDFEFAGDTYRWTSLYDVTDPGHHAVMGFDANVPSDSGMRTGTMQIGDKTIYLGETDEQVLRWFDDGDGWVVPRDSSEKAAPEFFPAKGQRLPLSLKARIPTNTGGGDQSGETQTPENENGQPGNTENSGPGNTENGEPGDSDDDQPGTSENDEAQRSANRELFQQCREYTRGLEGLRVCKPPFEGRDAVLMLTLASPAPAGGTTVTLATDSTQSASSDDYTMPSSITIGEGEVSGLLTIAITADGVDEDHETINIYACISPGCDPLEDWDYNHGITIPGTLSVGGL